MSSIYIHIPFCRQACYYCDFHFSTNTAMKSRMVKAIGKELILQGKYLPENETIETLYFGGGTPSLLSRQELDELIETVKQYYPLSATAEITLEANPDDLTPAKLNELKQAGINRLSIGIQSFHEAHLRFMNRAHSATEAYGCVVNARDAGFENISIDLIYAVPEGEGTTVQHSLWRDDLDKVLSLRPPHISAYCLTIEQKTVFGNWLKKGNLPPIEEEFAAGQYEILVEVLTASGYEHYEISNFALPGHYSRHNTNYWKKGAYLGVGPSAHSYNGWSRQYNIAHNKHYIDALEKGELSFEKEELSREDHINEYMMVSLRTMWGCDTNFLKNSYGFVLPEKQIGDYCSRDLLTFENGIIRLTEKGRLLADNITGSLFVSPT